MHDVTPLLRSSCHDEDIRVSWEKKKKPSNFRSNNLSKRTKLLIDVNSCSGITGYHFRKTDIKNLR